MTAKKSRIEQIVDQVNSKNAKRLAYLLVICFTVYHAALHIKYGTNSCTWLLSDGRYKGDMEWQPYGCMLHIYSKIDTRKCLRYIAFYGNTTHFLFIGDSRMKALYNMFIEHIQIGDETAHSPLNDHMDYQHVDNKLKIKVEFFWFPYVDKLLIDYLRGWSASNTPSVLIMGNALWSIKTFNGSKDALKDYKVNLTRLVEPFEKLTAKKTNVLWALQDPINQDKLTPEDQVITNEQIDLYNKVAIEVFSYTDISLWLSIRLVGQGLISHSPDGIHLGAKSLRHDTQILLNMYCNDYMNFDDGTCCSSTEPYTTLQVVVFATLAVCLIITLVMILYRTVMKWRGSPVHEYTAVADSETPTGILQAPGNLYTFFLSLAAIICMMAYFFVCDRTNFFMKENKYYSEFSFWLPIGYMTILGLFFTEDSKYTKVLHRDQLYEWKGWMILVILVYHITGASRVLPINIQSKVLISSYLFLLGYEHFSYMWYRNDIGIVRLFRVLFQLNFTTVTLCLVMNRPYQFYNFIPLLSFWYLMIYCFLAFPPRITAQSTENNLIHYFYLILKLIVLFIVITILFMSEVFFEKVFVTRPWKALFVSTDDDIRDWWFRWKLDRYSVMFGMGFAVIHHLAQRYSLFDDNHHGNLFSRGIALTATLGALIGLGCYITFTFLCVNELDCSEIHSYIVFIPIVSYIILRNISGVLRTRYSSFFAWFGEISLELFIGQYHIWLAADTHGVLVLLPGFPVLNVIITSFIFVCASHEIHRLTKVLLPYAVPLDWKLVLRNFILFLALLVPIGINDGMF